MRRRVVLAVLLVFVGLGGMWLWGSDSDRPIETKTLPLLVPRGDSVRGVEVFAVGQRQPEDLVDLCEAVNAAVAMLLGRPVTSPEGLRIHLFASRADCKAYTLMATGKVQDGAAYIYLDGQRLIVLHPDCDAGLLQHEMAHDAIQSSMGVVPRWFSEGVAVQVESWADLGSTLSWRPGVRWASRYLDLAEEGALPTQTAVEGEGPFLAADDAPAYARSWATVESLILLQRTRGAALLPAHGFDPGALEELGQTLAEHWARPAARVDGLLARSGASSDPLTREILLSLAEVTLGRPNPAVDPLEEHRRLSRAVVDGSRSPDRAFRAAAAAMNGRGEAEDFLRLAKAAERCGAKRAAHWAREQGLRSHPDSVALRGGGSAGALERDPVRVTRVGGRARVELASDSWDRAELESLAGLVLRAAEAVGEGLDVQPRWQIRVEHPGAGAGGADEEFQLLGWPRQPRLLRELAKVLRVATTRKLSLDPWKIAGWERVIHGILDPVSWARTRGEARRSTLGPHSIDSALTSFSPIDPACAAVAALRVQAPAESMASRLRSADAKGSPLSAAWLLAVDPGHPDSVAAAKASLTGADLRFALLAALYMGGDCRGQVALGLEADRPRAAKLLQR